jgi:hypothetical protein
MRQLPAIKIVVMVAADTRWPDIAAAAADKPLPDVAAVGVRWLAPPVADMDRLAMAVADVLSSDLAAAAATTAADRSMIMARSTTAAPVMATAIVDAPAMVFPLSAP